MGYLDSRASEIKVCSQSESQSLAVPVEVTPKAKFNRILFSVIALGIVAGMQYVDENMFKRKVRIVTMTQEDTQRVEPTFLENLFCKGNRRPKFCR